MSRIIFNTLEEASRPIPDGLSDSQRAVLQEQGIYRDPGSEFFWKHDIIRFDPTDGSILIDKPVKLVENGKYIDATFIRFKTGHYAYLDYKYSDFLRKCGKESPITGVADKSEEVKEIVVYEIHEFKDVLSDK